MKTKTKVALLKTPLILVMIISFAASIYATIKQIQGVNWATPVIMGILLVLYFVGVKIDDRI